MSVLRVAWTTPEVYCKQYGIIFLKQAQLPISKKITAAKRGKVVISVSVLRVARTTPEVYCNRRSETREAANSRVRAWGCKDNTRDLLQ